MKTPISWFNISWTSNMDGPGTRVVLYLSGCLLRCPWCHSPHSWEQVPTLMFFDERCLMCGACQGACPNAVHEIIEGQHSIDRSRCKGCGECVRACPTVVSNGSMSGALALPVSRALPEALFKKLRGQLDLLKGIGGLTISGGEPLLQYRPLKQLLQKCRKSGYHTAVETSGSVPEQNMWELLDLVDCWLFGLRPIFGKPHKKKLAADMQAVEANIRLLARSGKGKVIVRTPIVPGYTDSKRTFLAVATLMDECGMNEIELLPFNPHSRLFYDAMGMVFPINGNSRMAQDGLEKANHFFKEWGMVTKVV